MTDTISIERDCERLIFDFAYFNDLQEYESLVELFVDDGVMQRPNGERIVGRDALLKAYRSRPADRTTRHVCTNVRITAESAHRARGFTYAVVYSASADEPAKVQVGEFEDAFVKTADGWRFAERRARFMMHT